MSIRCKCKIIKKVYSKDNFQIFGCMPLEDNFEVTLNNFGNFTITGDLGMLEEGNEYELELEETEGRYGKQYNVISIPSFEVFNISDIDAIDNNIEFTMLTNIMSDSQAQNLNKAYPDFIRRVLKGEESSIDYKNIYNVAEVRLKSYISKVNSLFKYFKLMSSNKDLEITYSDCIKICTYYPSMTDAQKNIDANPYNILITILDRSFPKSDSLIIKAKPKFIDSDLRCEYLTVHLLKENENDGNTRIYGNDLANYVNDWDNCLLKRMGKVCKESEMIYFDESTKDLSLMATYIAECHIALDLVERLHNSRVLDIDYKKYQHGEYDLTNEQMEILRLVCEQDVAMLVGNSGSGKSTSVQALITMLEDNHLSYTLLAPTGIAAKRLKETTHRKASTIHRLLFNDTIIDSDVLIIDEMSMVSVQLLSNLLNIIVDYTKVIMICDNEQLASISCGNIVQNILESNIIPIARLTKVFRYNTSGLITVATDIRNGKDYLTRNLEQFNDYKFVTIEKEPIEQIINEYKKLLDMFSYKDILILSPYNVGSFGTYVINTRLQAEVNPLSKNDDNFVERKVRDAPNGIITFRKGDKVINTKNNYNAKTIESIDYNRQLKNMEHELEQIKDFDGEKSEGYYNYLDKIEEFKETAPKDTFVMNGEIGYIIEVRDNNAYVQFDENIIVYDKSDLQNLLLAYAISIHKCQGSQSKAVMVITHPSQERMLTKNLLYVADTRAQEYLIEIGNEKSIRNALSKSENLSRKTWLLELLRKEEFKYGKTEND